MYCPTPRLPFYVRTSHTHTTHKLFITCLSVPTLFGEISQVSFAENFLAPST